MPPSPHVPPAGARYRLLKRILRYLPRRAALHRYPVIGRFAASLRPRAYLWSIRRADVRRAYYAGSILAFLPLMGVQMPLALVAALTLRCNFMVLGGLQLITNPITAGPIYFLTHQLGSAVFQQVTSGNPPPAVAGEAELVALVGSIGEPLASDPVPVKWTTRAREAIAAMAVGGVIIGVVVGALMDLVDRFARPPARAAPMPRREEPA